MPGETGELLSVREIRSYERLNLDHLGTVVIVADLKRVIGDLPKDWGEGRRHDCDVGRAGAVFL
jgi:two-component system sensor histidine kinase YesM